LYAYVEAGRLTSRTTPEGTQTYRYAGNTERVASIETPTGERLAFDYDGPLPTATRWSGTINGSLGTEWNSDFQVAAHGIDGQYRVPYIYDGDGLLTRAGDLTLTRDANHGAVTGTSLGQLATARTYNPFGEPQEDRAAFGSDALYQTDYTRDRLGRITEKTETVQGETHIYGYTYDAAGRLTQVTTDGHITGSWGYDGNGNRIEADAATAGTFDAQDRQTRYQQTHTRPVPRGDITVSVRRNTSFPPILVSR
jgi:YD repeat-containing protein